jgi:hypothetical protein
MLVSRSRRGSEVATAGVWFELWRRGYYAVVHPTSSQRYRTTVKVLRALEAERKKLQDRQKASPDQRLLIDRAYLDKVRSELRRDLGRLRTGPPVAF